MDVAPVLDGESIKDRAYALLVSPTAKRTDTNKFVQKAGQGG